MKGNWSESQIWSLPGAMALSRPLYICYPNCRVLVLKSSAHYEYSDTVCHWNDDLQTVYWKREEKAYAQTACKYLSEQTVKESSLKTQINLIAKHHETVADQTCAREVKDKKSWPLKKLKQEV